MIPTPLRIIHVDDDDRQLAHMRRQLADVPGIVYVGGFLSALDALSFLKTNTADLIFTDVEMPEHDGLWLAEQLRGKHGDIAFVTAHAGYALQAFDACGLYYLLKPVSPSRLQELIANVMSRARSSDKEQQAAQATAFRNFMDPSKIPDRLFINTGGRIDVLKLSEVLYLGATSNYTTIVLDSGERHTSSKTIKIYDDALLHHPDFMRISRSYVVNKSFVTGAERDADTRKITIYVKGGHVLETGFKTKEEVMEWLAR